MLVADDTSDIRTLVRKALQRAGGFEVVAEAADGPQTVDLAERERPDVVLLDLGMPGMSGLEVLERLRARVPDAKLVVFSGFDAVDRAADAARSGAHAYIEKGTDGSQIAEVLRRLAGPGAAERPAPPIAADDDVLEHALGILVHELSSPVTAIEGFSELLDRPAETIDPEALGTAVSAIRRNATQLRSVLTAVTEARRIDAGTLDLRLSETDLGSLVQDTVAAMGPGPADHPVSCRIERDIRVTVDPARIRRVVTTLLHNAAKFSPPGSPIEVEVQRRGGAAEVRVRDHGSGISAADRDLLFARFTQVHRGPGAGLGLYVARGLARAHGGDVELAASSADGSCFVLRLPVGSTGDER